MVAIFAEMFFKKLPGKHGPRRFFDSHYLAANPLAGDTSVFDGGANDAREAAIVRRLLQGGPLSVVVLGGAHDLSEEVRAAGNCEYLRVFVEGYPADE